VYLTKHVLRRLMSWYVGPFAADQRNFNHTVLRVADELGAGLDALAARLDEVAAAVDGVAARIGDLGAEVVRREGVELERRDRRIAELDDRVLRLERARRPAAPAGPEPEPGAEAIDYFGFETRMRGSTVDIRERQRPYLEDFRHAAPVLDIGCGRGEFLSLLREAGIEASGVDTDADMVAFARGEGLDVQRRDALAHLADLSDVSLGGIFCAHVVEHLEEEALVRLLALSHAKLRPGGLLVAETPNPRTLVTLRTFFADSTHVRPLHPDTLSFLARHAGFDRIEIRYLNDVPPEGRLRPVPLPDGPARDALHENVERLNEVIFGPQDYALLARK
jgi:O-antigen chain-terminating methyltransferase